MARDLQSFLLFLNLSPHRGAIMKPTNYLALTALVAVAAVAVTVDAAFLVGGTAFQEILHDDFSGTGATVGDLSGYFVGGTGVDTSHWCVGTTCGGLAREDGTLIRGGGQATFDTNGQDIGGNGFSGQDDAFAWTRPLHELVGENEWAYEVVFTVYDSTSASSDARLSAPNRQVMLLCGRDTITNTAEDVGLFFTGSRSGNYNVAWSTDRGIGAATDIMTGLVRGVSYTVSVHHWPDDSLDIYLDGVLQSTQLSIGAVPPDRVGIGDFSGATAVRMDVDSFRIGVVPEPCTLTWWVLGPLAIWFRRRQRVR